MIEAKLARGSRPLFVSVHSMTDRMNGSYRPWEISFSSNANRRATELALAALRKHQGVVIGTTTSPTTWILTRITAPLNTHCRAVSTISRSSSARISLRPKKVSAALPRFSATRSRPQWQLAGVASADHPGSAATSDCQASGHMFVCVPLFLKEKLRMTGSIGKSIRLGRLLTGKHGRSACLAFDHGLHVGPIAGAGDLRAGIKHAVDAGFDGIILTPGAVARNVDLLAGRDGRRSSCASTRPPCGGLVRPPDIRKGTYGRSPPSRKRPPWALTRCSAISSSRTRIQALETDRPSALRKPPWRRAGSGLSSWPNRWWRAAAC